MLTPLVGNLLLKQQRAQSRGTTPAPSCASRGLDRSWCTCGTPRCWSCSADASLLPCRAWLLLDLLKQRTGPFGPPWMSLNPPGPPAGAAGEHSEYLAAAFGARAVVSCSELSPRSRPDPAQQPVAILKCPGSLTEE